jgi:hypothetical protein
MHLILHDSLGFYAVEDYSDRALMINIVRTLADRLGGTNRVLAEIASGYLCHAPECQVGILTTSHS